MPDTAAIEVIADIEGENSWVNDYLSTEGGRAVTVHAGGAELVDAVTARWVSTTRPSCLRRAWHPDS